MLTCSPFNFMDHSKKLIISRLLETYYLTEFANDEMCEYHACKQIRSRTALLLAVAVCAHLFPQSRENLFYRTKGQHCFSSISLPLSPNDSLFLPLSSSFFCFVFFFSSSLSFTTFLPLALFANSHQLNEWLRVKTASIKPNFTIYRKGTLGILGHKTIFWMLGLSEWFWGFKLSLFETLYYVCVSHTISRLVLSSTLVCVQVLCDECVCMCVRASCFSLSI